MKLSFCRQLNRVARTTLPIVLLSGCPQMLYDGFRLQNLTLDHNDGARDASSDTSDMYTSGGSGGGGDASADRDGSAGSGGGDVGADSGTNPEPDAATPPPEAGPPACVATTELCDGVDNDCDDQVDPGATCPSDCVGVVILGRSYMYCGGSGALPSVAETRCVAQGMRLVSIESSGENAAIVAAVAPLHASLSTVVEVQSSIWLAAQDIAEEGTWRWGASGPIFWHGSGSGYVENGAYPNWSTGKPNDNATPNGEDCGVLYLVDGPDDGLGQWNDFACTIMHAFLCEQAAP